MQSRFTKKSKNTLIAVIGALITAPILLAGVEAASASGANANGLTVNPAQRQAIAAGTAKHTAARRDKQTRAPHNAAAGLDTARLQRALRTAAPLLERRAGKSALIDDTQRNALRALNASAREQGGVRAHFDARNGTLAFLKPQGGETLAADIRALAPDARTPDLVAQQFLAGHRALLKLDDPRNETRLTRQTSDGDGRNHVRLQQVYRGVPLWGKELLVHMRGANGVYLVQGSYEPTPRELDITPAISEQKALAAVRADLRLQADVTGQSELVIHTPDNGIPLLAYKIEIMPAPDARWIYFVNARSGKIAHRIKDIHANVVTANGIDLHGVNRSFNAWSQSGQYYLVDPNTPAPDTTPDPITSGPNPTGDTFILSAQNGDGSSLAYNSSAAQNTGWNATAVSAAHNTRVVYDYYKNTFGRDSLDGKGMNLMVVTHFQSNYNNAFWNGTFMVYGDGDGQVFNGLAGCLDVAAHEMSHGVIEHSANLIYQNQSGALNESFADIFGAMVDGDDWLMGEDCTAAAPGFLRSLKNPAQGLSPQPARMSEYRNLPNTEAGDNGGVHVNSGIPNRAAYLIAEGLSAEGLGTSIGRDKTARIFYRALTVYLTASAQFADARRATIQAAADLYNAGSVEEQAVTAAWDAVEVTDSGTGGAATPKPTSTDAVAGDDLMVYLFPRDGVYDTPGEATDLYMQVMDKPFTGYKASSDIGPLNVNTKVSPPALIDMAPTRPAAYTDQHGTWILYVGADNNLYINDPSGANEAITTTGDIYSIATSPDGRYFAYTSKYASDNTIHVLDLVGGDSSNYPITPPSYQEGGGGADTIFYADSLAFDYSGRFVIFDALNCLSTPNDACDIDPATPNTGYQYWSIGQLNVTNGQLFFPFPNQSPAIDLGYPGFAANNQSIIAFDYSDYSTSNAIASSVRRLNLETQEATTLYSFADTTVPHFGTASFWGNDDFLSIKVPDATKGFIAQRIGIDGNWNPTGTVETINPYAVQMPVMHRAGVRALTGGLGASVNALDFGTVTSGDSKSLTLTLTNGGNNDVNITDVVLSGNAFRHNATNVRVPRGSSLPVTITFASAAAGTQAGTLTFTSDGTPSTLTVSLVGTATVDSGGDGGSGGGNKGGGGGGAFDIWTITLIASAPWLRRRFLRRRI